MGFQGSLSFPANPVIGQTHDHVGKTYRWTGIGWRQITPSLLTADIVGLELLAAASINNVASIDFVLTSFLSSYRAFTWKINRFTVANDGVAVWMRVSTDGGVSFDSAASAYSNAGVGARDDPVVGAITSETTALLFGSVGNGANEGWTGHVELWKPTSAALWPRITWSQQLIDSTATPHGLYAFGGGARHAAQDTDAVRFLCASGNIINFDYALYGWR